MNIVLLESLAIGDSVLNTHVEKLVQNGHSFRAFERTTDVPTLIEEAREADVIMIANMPLPGEVISACPNLKFIDVAFTGVDHVDLAAAKAKGVAVSNASGYSNQSVAELVLGMTISLLRNIPQTEKRCREEGTKDGLVGRELKGRTVGIVGYGAIGKKVAEIFHLLGCKVLAYSEPAIENAPDYVTCMGLNELLKESDIVTLHCPLMEGTKGLINKEKLDLMKEDAILINCARGPVVDMPALADALNEGRIGGAGVDVFEVEPPIKTSHPLLQAKNCLVTPHIAFASKESMMLRADIVFDSLEKWLGGSQVNVILPR